MKRRCRNAKCRAILRELNPGPLCGPCQRTQTEAHLERDREEYRRRVANEEMPPLSHRIRGALPGTAPEVAERIGANPAAVSRTMSKMAARGHLIRRRLPTRRGRGGTHYVYMLPDEAAEAA